MPARYGQTETKGRPKKYRNQPTEYAGYLYDSKAEAKFAEELDILRYAKVLRDWNQQVTISFDVTTDGHLIARSKSIYLPQIDSKSRIESHICKHIVDFLLVHDDNTIELVEVKSKATKTQVWRLKRTLLEATLLFRHPEIEYRIAE